MKREPVSEPLSARRFPAADGVRGLAILVVVIHNSEFIERSSSSFLIKVTSAITATGWTGVELFFVLSGFLITGILLDSRDAPRYFRNFYIRRVLRIFPLYYSVLFIALFVVPLIANAPTWTAIVRHNQLWYWAYVSNWGDAFGHGMPGFSHFWSLAVEEQFYLVWPMLIFLLSRRRMIGLCAVMIAVTPLVRLWLRHLGLPPDTAYEFTIARWDALAAGALLALLQRDAGAESRLARWMRDMTVVSGVALAGLTLAERGFHADDLVVQVVGQSLIALLSASLVFYCVTTAAGAAVPVQRVMSARWLRFFGKYSYAIYVFHMPIHRLASSRLADAVNAGDASTRFIKLVAYLACVLAASTLAAMVSWRILEKPCLDLKDRLAPRRTHVAA